VAAGEMGLRITHHLNDVLSAHAQLGVVVAYGALIPSRILDELAMLNVHFSLLPRWRGAAPVERAILAGDELSGVCVMGLEATLDTGPIYARASTPVGSKRADELRNELAELGAQLLVETLSQQPLAPPQAQQGEANYAKKLTSADFSLDPTQSAEQLMRVVRLGRAALRLGERRLVVLSAERIDATVAPGSLHVEGADVILGTTKGALRLEQVRPSGSRTMSARDWWLGAGLDASTLQWGRDDHVAP
jgi:methionyl-tRNA formyltransferase